MKIKRIVGAALAAVMALSLTIPVMASGRDESIPGEGSVGLINVVETTLAPTIHKIDDGDTLVFGTNNDKYPGQEHLQENVEGATVTVTWPNGQGRSQATVDASGRWEVSTVGITLNDGDQVRAVQQEAGKKVSLVTVAIVGSGDPGTVEERSIAPTIAITPAGSRAVRGNNLPEDYDPSGLYPQENVPGATITVTWPDGSTGTTTVNGAGSWALGTPGNAQLTQGQKVIAVQTEPGKLDSYPVVVTVGDGKPGIVNPPIETINPEDYLILSMPTKFDWYVNQSDPEKVQSGQAAYPITVKSLTLPDNGGVWNAKVDVAMKSFTKTNNVTLPTLVLTFTGDIGNAVGLNTNVADGYPTPATPLYIGTASTYAGDDDTLTFGFGGTYGGKLSSNVQTPQYSMVLNFTLVETDGPIEIP